MKPSMGKVKLIAWALAAALCLYGCAEAQSAVTIGTQVIDINLAPTPRVEKLSMATPTPMPSPVPKPTDTPEPTATPTPTPTPTPTATPQATATPVATPTNEPGETEKPTPKPTKTPKPTEKPTPKPEDTPEPTSRPLLGSVVTVTAAPVTTAKPAPTPIESNSDSGGYSDEELELAARVALWEARGKGEDAYKAVLCVLYNRCQSKKFGGGLTSISTEVYRKSQFSVVRYDDFASDRAPDDIIGYADDVFNNGDRDLPEGVLFFRSGSLGETWGDKKYYETIGGNAFFYAG